MALWYVVFVFDQLYIKHVISTVPMASNWGRVYYNNLLALAPLLATGAVTDELTAFRQHSSAVGLGWCMASCVAGTGMSYFAWAEKSDLFYLCADDLTDYTGTESSLSDLDDDLDNTDLDNGCAGNPWMPFVEALPIRGIWQSIGLLPTHLFATVAASEDTVAEARIDWTVSHVDTDQQTMLLEVASTENVEIPDFKRHMKLQWHTNASDQHFICVLGNAPSSEEAQTIPTEVYSAGSCGVSWYGQDATWHPLIPTG